MNRRVVRAFVFAVVVVAFAGAEVFAQSQMGSVYTDTALRVMQTQNSAERFSSRFYEARAISSAVPRYNFSTVNRNLLQPTISSMTAPKTNKPFSSFNRGSTVSPYLELSSPFSSSASTYYTQVRPQLEQQRANEQMMKQQIMRQRELNSYAAKGPYDPQGSDRMAPTGHAAVYMNYGGYYPQASR
jgi:hypothetical protein